MKLQAAYFKAKQVLIEEKVSKALSASLIDHAKRELDLAGVNNPEADYGGMLGEATMELIECFSKQGHSGFSAQLVRDLFNRLADYQSLSPLTSDSSEWMEVVDSQDKHKYNKHPTGWGAPLPLWQSKRNPEAFSHDHGQTYYVLSDVMTTLGCAACGLLYQGIYGDPSEVELGDCGSCNKKEAIVHVGDLGKVHEATPAKTNVVASAFKKPYDPFKDVAKEPANMPRPLEGHPTLWALIADRVGHKLDQPVQQRAPVIGGRRRYHHRPLTSWRLSNAKTLTITTDEKEARTWNKIVNIFNPALPRIDDVFAIQFIADPKPTYWGVLHENLKWPPAKDWTLFVDTLFRWKAWAQDSLKPITESDMKDFLTFLVEDDSKDDERFDMEDIMPWDMKDAKREDIIKRRIDLLRDPDVRGKVEWAKSAIRFLENYKVTFRDFDPSNLAETTRGRTVITNLAESRSYPTNTGRVTTVKGNFYLDPLLNNAVTPDRYLDVDATLELDPLPYITYLDNRSDEEVNSKFNDAYREMTRDLYRSLR